MINKTGGQRDKTIMSDQESLQIKRQEEGFRDTEDQILRIKIKQIVKCLRPVTFQT